VISGSAEREGAFRWLENESVDVGEVARSSHEATAARCGAHPWVYVAVDQSNLSVTDRQHKKGLGKPSNRHARKTRGLEVMSALAISPAGVPLGVLGQQWWLRSDDQSPTFSADRRAPAQRESELWRSTMQQCEERLKGLQTAWYQMDRGADYWRVLEFAQEQSLLITVRAAHDRRLVESDKHLWATVLEKKVAGYHRVQLPARREANGTRVAQRAAKLAVRYARVTLQLTTYAREPLEIEVTAVHVRERRAERNRRVEWMLLTTAPVTKLADVKHVVSGYAQRWKIESFHRCWKSGGCNVQASQLRSPGALKRWATILAAVAARAERLKQLARSQPEEPAESEFSRAEIDAAIVLSNTRKFQPGAAMTLAQAVTLVAEAGGYTGKSSGGPPGSTTIRRGLDKVETGARVAEMLAKK
jgi:hypothetical protein